MPYFFHQVSYTTSGWKHLVRHPQDRYEPICQPIEALGGTVLATFYTTGRYDVLVITEFPEKIGSAEIAAAFASGGAVANIQTTPLLTANEAIDLWQAMNEPAGKPMQRGARHMVAAGQH